MIFTVQAITSEGDLAVLSYWPTKEEAFEDADNLVDHWCNGWRPGGKVVVSDESGEMRVTMLGSDPQEEE